MKTPFGMITVKEFSSERSQSIEMAIERIKNGTYKGKEIDGQWFVDTTELTNDCNNAPYSYSKNKVSSFSLSVTVIIFILINIGVFNYAGTPVGSSLSLLGSVVGGLTITGGSTFVISIILFLFAINSGDPKYKNETKWTIFLNIFIPTLIYISIIIWGVMLFGNMALNT